MAEPDVRIKGLALIDGFVIDCLLSDNHTFESEVTEFPVENGSTISDNIRKKPMTVVMECIISNTPIDPALQYRSEGSVPADDAYAMLLAIRRDRRLVQIATSLDHYDNMALETLTIPRSSGRGDELRFTATFKQVLIVENKRETRTIPAAQGGSRIYTEFFESTTRTISLNAQRRLWFDIEIQGWRADVQYAPPFVKGPAGTFIDNPINFERTSTKWVVTKDRPLEFTFKEWNALSDAQRKNDREVSRLLRIKRFNNNDNVPTVTATHVVSPSDYVIRHLG